MVPIGIPDGAPSDPVGGEIEAAVLELAPRRGSRSTKFSSGQVTIAGGSRGLTGAVQMSSRAAIRAGAGYATVAVPADLEPVFEAGQPEVMSAGCPGGDGLLAPASAKAVLRAFERAAAGVFGPGLGRDPASVELAREVVAGDRGAAGPRRRRAQRLRRDARTGSPPARRRRSSPRMRASSGGCWRSTPRRSPPTASPRRDGPPTESGAVVVLKGDDTIVTDGERVAVNVALGAGPRDRGHRRRALRDRRRAACPRPRAVRGRLRRRPRPRPRGQRRRRADRRRGVDDRHRRDRLDPRRSAARVARRSNNLAP